ncbi:MAG: membrane dipeptidase [Nitrososphaeria archaeon]
MGKNKIYTGYQSFTYLEPNIDYKPYKLVKQVKRVNSKIIELTKQEQERFEEIVEKYILISLHDHTKVYPENPELINDYIRSGRIFIGYEGIAASGLDAIFEALHNGTGKIESNDPWAWENIIYQIGMYLSDVEHQEFLFLVKKVEDILRAHKEGKVGIVIHLESIPNIGSNLDKIDVLYGLGVRCMGLSYSQGNIFCAGLAEKHDRGISDLGYEAIKRMNKLGIAIDLAHVSDKSRIEGIEASSKPVFITHAGARALWPSRRLVSDEALHALAEKGGVIGIEAAPHTTITVNRKRHDIESIMEHFEYISNLIGIDHVAFGPDTNFGDHVALHKIMARELAISAFREKLPPFEEVEFVDGLENPSEFGNVVRWLIKNGYSDQEIEKVVGGNILRVLKEVWIK